MKKSLAILLTLIFTFSSVSILGTGVALAEENKNYQTELVMESDFDDSNGTNWLGTNSNVTFMDENGDGVNDFARVNSSASKSGAGLVSNPFSLIPDTEYELSFEIRIPKDLSKSYLIGGSTFYAPNVLIYEPKLNSSETKVSSIPQIANTSTGNNLYAYNQSANADKGIEAWSRRPTFKADWQVGSFGTVFKERYSHLAYSDQKKLLGATTDAADAYSEWTTITANFTAVADEDGETSQIAAVGFNFQELKSDGYVFDVKNVKLVSKKEIKQNYILESDFDNADNTNWQGSKQNVQFMSEDDVSFARVNSTTSKGAGLLSPVFNLVPGNEYELNFDFRIPKELSKSYMVNGSTFYAPNFFIYEPKVGSSGVKVSSAPKIATTSTGNNLYAYSYTDKVTDDEDGDTSFKRRPSFKAEWQVGSFGTVSKEKYSYLAYSDHKKFIGDTTDAADAYSEWTNVTVKFTAIADEAGETSQTAALGFTFHELGVEGYIFDVKDVKLLETADAVVKEPEITEDVVYYEGFESLADPTSAVTVYNGVNANLSWVEPTISAGDATTGKNSYSVYAMYQHIFIPFDKSKLVNDTVYSVSLDWKLLEYTNEKKRQINNIYLVGYTPEEGVAFKDNYKAIAGVATLNGTGKWENAKFNFKVSDYSKYEQYGIYILYKTSGTNTDPDDRLYLDTILVRESADQSVVDPLEIKEEPRTEDTIKVLAFGNSFSNDGTSFIPQIAAADGKDIRVGDCSIGGCPISKHYNNSVTNSPAYTFNYRQASGSKGYGSSITMRQALEATDWDYITIQQVSTQSGDYSTFNYQLEHLINYFKEVCPNAKILLHSTWAYKDGIVKDGYEKYDNDQVTMYNAIKETYLKASEDYGFIQIIPTGEAIQRLRGQMSDTLFTTETEGSFTRDGYHLSEKGRVAAALVWYEIFTGVSAVDCNIDLTEAISTLAVNNGANIGITAEEEIAIKNAAHEASALYKKANEAQLAIEAIGEVTANSGDAIAKANALRAELNDDTFLPNLQTLIDANEAFNNLGSSDEVLGDFDGTGEADLNDIAALAQHFAGWEGVNLDDANLDISGDGEVNLYDLVKLAQIVAKWSK